MNFARAETVCPAIRQELTRKPAESAEKQQPPGEPTAAHVATFIPLQQVLTDNIDCLFVFVEHPEVEPANNRSTRNARREVESA